MSWVDDLGQAVAASPKIDASMRDLLGTFLQSNRSTLEQLGPALGDAFFRTLSDQGPAAAWEIVAQSLAPAQVVSMLEAAQRDMAALADARTAQADAARQLVNSIAETALLLIVRALLAAL
jgi:hypothetical protein